MAIRQLTRDSVERLLRSLDGYHKSRMLKNLPQFQSDLRFAAAILRWMLEHGMPVSPVEIDDSNGYHSVS
jgi:hypothetical protein